jgi:tetratricopeptide (TPR) repeat protein
VILLAAVAPLALAQPQQGTHTLIVMPFENESKTPGVDWLSEACSEVLLERMQIPGLYIIDREERVFAFDRAGVPATVKPTRATVFRVAEQMSADFVVLGSYRVEANAYRASAQVLEVKNLRLRPAVTVSGPLPDFVALQTSLAWNLLQGMPDPPRTTREQFFKAAPPIRLDVFENFMRGVVSTSNPQKIRYFKEALKADPNYSEAAFQLGKVYYESHDYEQAITWLAKVPNDDPEAGEATFLLGMSAYNHGDMNRAYSAFNSLIMRLPLTVVYNNLGVVDARRGRRTAALDFFSKAVAADPNDADYRFNLAVAQFKNGDNTAAMRQLREELQLRPTDAEAKALLDAIARGVTFSAASGGTTGATQVRIPIERIKRNYDEASYRQIEMQIQNLQQQVQKNANRK